MPRYIPLHIVDSSTSRLQHRAASTNQLSICSDLVFHVASFVAAGTKDLVDGIQAGNVLYRYVGLLLDQTAGRASLDVTRYLVLCEGLRGCCN